MAQDYILRLVDQIALMLAELLRLPKSQQSERLATICLQQTGLPFEVVKRSAPEVILQLLASGGATRHARAVILAELLLQDAQLSHAAGKGRDAIISRAQARALLEHSIDQLAPEEQGVYRPKLTALRSSAAEDSGSYNTNS